MADRVDAVRPIAVGTTESNYNIARNFMEAPVPGVTFGQRGNWLKPVNHLTYRLFGYLDPVLHNLEYGSRGFDLLHFWNAESMGSTPWLTTLETVAPRWSDKRKWGHRFGVQLLARPACKRLIAISDSARADQLLLLRDHPDMADEVAAKLTVLHPPQRLLSETSTAAPDGLIRCVTVGKDFFRKGGREILRAFDRLLGEGLPIHLTIVSTLFYGDYASQTTAADLEEAKRLIAKWPDRIVHHHRLPNPEVLELFRQSHVGLLPTWGDSYGYSVLEAQAAGCPVLTTDLRALAEINDDECGWVIAMPQNAHRDGQIATEAERAIFSEQLLAGIEVALRSMADDPAGIATRGAKSLDRIRRHHDPLTHAGRLRVIYEEALGWR